MPPQSRKFLFSRQPIVVDEHGVIIVGHGRYWAALKLGLEKVPVHVPLGWSPAKIKAYRIADNKTAELSTWNYDLLPLELADLQTMNYDLGLLGFDQVELAKLLDPGLRNGLCDPDEVPAPPEQAITRPGDLWLLGDHRLLRGGDSAKAADVDRLVDGQPMHLVNTDPPYNVKCEPRSNNAIAAGLSSFEKTPHQRMAGERNPEKKSCQANSHRYTPMAFQNTRKRRLVIGGQFHDRSGGFATNCGEERIVSPALTL